ncbi:unnamed protein product [Rodentolepis nana]|uniref:Uncharacterized protein n=1 Tax=Rodentolepis nana TaxID=102285 RepID=A0A0R3T8Y0_RODNA|nr:unnamed protein product [Rodentolepis nana]
MFTPKNIAGLKEPGTRSENIVSLKEPGVFTPKNIVSLKEPGVPPVNHSFHKFSQHTCEDLSIIAKVARVFAFF